MSTITYKANGVKAVRDHVLVKGMDFSTRTLASGVLIAGDDGKSSGIRPRWAEVIAVGPHQKDIEVGEFVLVDHGRWTRELKVEIDGEVIDLRRIDPLYVLCASKEKLLDESWSMAVSGDDNSHRIEGSMHNHAGGGLTD